MLAIPDQTNPKAVHGKVSVPCLRGKRNPITAGHKLNWKRAAASLENNRKCDSYFLYVGSNANNL